ncbi:hypothetical protein EW026_g275 [Hermanssonia centrifuga]|uniref:S1 motif domain-containing protein n=1 Tax=Hermanssonia centrifuga TaxID=98765 RepID=A0A4S4KUX2_9APHY|nr:hypothetical protein EW026_g275 [Hermanssonia centrifuga]
MAPGVKRGLEDASGSPKPKKTKVDEKLHRANKSEKPSQVTSTLAPEDVDFPRGGGTSFTPLEVKAIRAEAVQEANMELFEDTQRKHTKKDKRSAGAQRKHKETTAKDGKAGTFRVEHLNYKRITVGMKILGQIVSVEPLALIVSLPNQLMAHVPITNISSQLTHLLESMDDDEPMESPDDDETERHNRVPELFEIFHPGQYVRAVVSAVHAQGSTNIPGLPRERGEAQKASRRIELSLVPEKVNEGVVKSDVKPGVTLSAAIRSVEDHGYILELGIPEVSGFLSFADMESTSTGSTKRLSVGHMLDVYVSKLTEVSSVTSVLPGCLVQGLITAVLPTGLNLQVLGFFNGSVDQFHLPPGDVEENYKLGKKVQARVLYDISPSTPPRFALSLAKHVVSLTSKFVNRSDDDKEATIQEAFPIGTILDTVEVVRVESERGLIVRISSAVEGVVHISQVSDDHVATLSPNSGPWKIGTMHRARVTGYHPLDGLLQLSLQSSVLDQRFLQVSEVQVGEVIKGTVKRLTDSAMFVSISGNVDGVVWPNHYADIALKHPQKRFKPGGSIKCRILVVDPERKRVVLTAKKTLIESKLPIISNLEDAKEGLLTHAVVFKTSDKSLQVEFYNNLKAIIPIREASETAIRSLSEAFPVGKVVQVRILSVDRESSRIVASIRQAATNFKIALTAIQDIEIGNVAEGIVAEVQKDKVIVTLQPSQVRALLSLNNLANRRGTTLAQVRTSLQVGEKIENLVVTSRNPEKGFVLVATKPKEKDALLLKHSLTIDTVQVGQLVGGRILRHNRHGALVKLTPHVSGSLHPTDTCDDFETGNPFPSADSIIKATVISIDKDKRQLTLSTRPSRLHPERESPVIDKEINDLSEIQVGATVRGFIKTVAEHGLFVTLGRGIDARVQIKELFDAYVKDWKSHFTANKLVKGRILSVDTEKKQVEMTFKTGELSRNNMSSLQLADMREGQKVDGTVKKIEDYGLFIEIEGSKLRGLCHKSELSDNKDADVSMALRSFREGDRVKAMVLSVDLDKRRLSLGLKPSYFAEEDFQPEANEDDEDEDEPLGVVEQDEIPSDVLEEREDESSEDEDMHVDLDTEINRSVFDDNAKQNKAHPISRTEGLKLGNGFQWSADHLSDDSNSESSEGEGEDVGQTERKKKRRRKEIEQDLTADLHTKVPESNADFERLLLGSPNSSYLWIQYMSFQLQLSEVEKARELARRALKTINFREEHEKLNVWIALLNLENVYGSDESLETTFKDAARHNDSKTVHLRLAAIFDDSEQPEKAEEQYKRTCKKFGQSSKVWTLFGEHYLKHGKFEEARNLLPRSLQSLDQRKHLKTISKFAQLEYKSGDPERGKTIFEGIVDSHPKRWDLWSIYLDMEVNQGDIASLRNLFERILALKMTSHKAKSFFKKWLELERRLGDEEGASIVKAKAIEWTQRAATSA